MTKLEPRIVLERPDFLIADKPSGLLTMPARGDLAGAKHMVGLLHQKLGRVFVVHRLDKDASGLIIFARTPEAHRFLSMQFETRAVEKEYLVAVKGEPEERRGTIDKPLKQRGSGRMSVAFDGKPSVTRYELVRPLKGASLLKVSIVTGRRHQIRAHLYSLGHPVLGDPLYGEAAEQAKFPRLMLHSWKLRFKDPEGKTVAAEADPPRDFTDVLDVLYK